MAFTVKVSCPGKSHEFRFQTNGRFPYHSDIQAKIREAFKIADNVPVYWHQVLFYPVSAASGGRLLFKKNVCDAAEYEDAQKPFLSKRYFSPALQFDIIEGTGHNHATQIINARQEGRALLKAESNLSIEYEKLELQLQKDAELIATCEQKIRYAVDVGKDNEASLWSVQLSLHQKASEAIKMKLEACNSERIAVSHKLERSTFSYSTFRGFLAAEDAAEARWFERAALELYEGSSSPSAQGAGSLFPPLDHIIPEITRRGHRGPAARLIRDQERRACRGKLLPPPPPEIDPANHLYYASSGFLARHGLQRPRPFEPPYADRLPPGFRDEMGSGAIDPVRATNPLDGPYQALMQAKMVFELAIGEIRHYIPKPPALPQGSSKPHPRPEETHAPAHVLNNPFDDMPMEQPVTWADAMAEVHRRRAARRDTSPVMTFEQKQKQQMQQKANRSGPRYNRSYRASRPVRDLYRHTNICCDGCQGGIKGLRFKCKDCDDYDLCSGCLLKNEDNEDHPSDHVFNTIVHPGIQRQIDTVTRALPQWHSASCDLCHERICGKRIKCLDCPDWDCCETCLDIVGERHPGHNFVKINSASDLLEPPFVHHKVKHSNIICDMCNKTVVGTRWKCVHPTCEDYDLCDNCHSSPLNLHPREHPILKLSAPVDIDFVSRIRGETVPGKFRPAQHACDFAKREGEYTPWIKSHRDAMMITWDQLKCKDHKSFEECERARIRGYVGKGVLQGPGQKRSSQDGTPPKRVKLSLPDVEDIKQEDVNLNQAGPSSAMEIDEPLEAKSSALGLDEFEPGSHPDIIKCYMYPPTLAVCPVKPEQEERPMTPFIDPSIDTETPTQAYATEEILTPSNDAIFASVQDVTIPAGCSLPVGAEFTKTWSMKHLVSGHEYKFDQLRLVHESKGLVGEACFTRLAFNQDDIKTGEKVEVSIAGLKVPDLPDQQVTEQWRFRDVEGTAYGEPLKLRFTVENPSLQNSLCNSSFIMPTPNQIQSRANNNDDTEIQMETETNAGAPSQSSVPSTPRSVLSYDSLVSLDSTEADDFAIIERVASHQSHQSIATALTDDQLASEFDFVDESEDAQSQSASRIHEN